MRSGEPREGRGSRVWEPPGAIYSSPVILGSTAVSATLPRPPAPAARNTRPSPPAGPRSSSRDTEGEGKV